MNYRHAFHAGNPGDVLKHLVLVLCLEHLRRKAKPFVYLDTHAGRGLYDLAADSASRTEEHVAGIRRLWGRPPGDPSIARYLEVVAGFNGGAKGGDAPLRHYPGSPAIAAALLRADDRMILCELHPEECAALRRQLGDDPRVAIHERDGYEGLRALLPPPIRRGLVLMDPPFERADEWDALAEGLRLAHRRFATATLAAWYPVKGGAPLAGFEAAVADAGIDKILKVELATTGDRSGDRMVGSRVLLINPPWRLDEALCAALPRLARELASAPGEGQWAVEWLVGERSAGAASRRR
ncbi:MAG: 23S rRNA (adenine(2030)-N(6))-methyltransferase RlmJ [Myxococcales bacterium]|nr:23S rRNA (adenine(2030)-N(6))-methyltransferase RlmJ [Myxococcales bacterium]